MPNLTIRVLLFLSSYFPLALIFFTLFLFRNIIFASLCLSLGILGWVATKIYLSNAQCIAGFKAKIVEIQRRDGESMSYIVTYIIPFLAIPFNGWEQGVALIIFFFMLGVLYVNSNLIHINPMLNLSGYHLYEVTLENGGVHSLITKDRVVRNEVISVVKIGEDILLKKE